MLRRDPMESRANRELGLMALHRGEWARAKELLNRSLENDPLNEGFFAHQYLGVVAMHEWNLAEAKKELTVASRVARLRTSADYNLAVIAMRSGDYSGAVRLLKEAIAEGGTHPALWSTMAVACRKLGSSQEAAWALNEALERDPLEFLALAEKWQRDQLADSDIHAQFDRKDPSFVGSQLYLETAARYADLGTWQEAAKVLEAGVRHFERSGKVYAILDYYLGYCYDKLGRPGEAKTALARAAGRNPEYVFPYRLLDIDVLQTACSKNTADGRAPMYLGNALFYLRRYKEANAAWRESLDRDPGNATALRNLALGRWVVDKDRKETIALLERASDADPSDGRLLMEVDAFLDAARETSKRAALLEKRRTTVMQRDELVLSWARLLLRLKQYDQAAAIVDAKRFFARESSAHAHAVYAEAHYGMGESLLASGKAREALEQFKIGMRYPENLGEGAPANEVLARVQYLTGLAHEALGDTQAARSAWSEAATAKARPDTESAMFQAIALRKLNRSEEADKLLRASAERCRKALADSPRNEAVLNYVLARIYGELGDKARADSCLKSALDKDPDVVLHARIEASRPTTAPE